MQVHKAVVKVVVGGGEVPAGVERTKETLHHLQCSKFTPTLPSTLMAMQLLSWETTHILWLKTCLEIYQFSRGGPLPGGYSRPRNACLLKRGRRLKTVLPRLSKYLAPTRAQLAALSDKTTQSEMISDK